MLDVCAGCDRGAGTWLPQHWQYLVREAGEHCTARPHRRTVVLAGSSHSAVCCRGPCLLHSFLNCILQALASLPSFTSYLDHLHALVQSVENSTPPRTPPSTPPNSSIASRLSAFLSPSRSLLSHPPSSSELLHHFLLIQSGSQRDPTPLYRLLTGEAVQFRGFRQQDAHELLLAILDLFDKRLARVQQLKAAVPDGMDDKQLMAEETKEETRESAPSVPEPTDPFVGSTSQFLVCLTCSYSSPPTRTSFNTLTLPLPQLQYYSMLAPGAARVVYQRLHVQ